MTAPAAVYKIGLFSDAHVVNRSQSGADESEESPEVPRFVLARGALPAGFDDIFLRD